ncbi:cytochrome P450 [Actinomadura rugatobispora]|uniref:Cytochrome P450 n=1 Tax=Actinomadura rugatobispora TaxID=1994 RepID=A0ABW1ABK3_9ACTN|nr:cytochrome P450 [Actinomadura rugatobispora]
MTNTPAAPSLPMARDRGPFDPPADLAEMAREPVSRLRYPDGSLGWLVTGHEEGNQVHLDQRFSAKSELRVSPVAPAGAPKMPAPPGMFVFMDPPDHTRLRNQVAKQFTARRMKLLAEGIEELTDKKIKEMKAAGDTADLIEALARPVPGQVICDILGVAYEDRDSFQAQMENQLALDASPEEVMGQSMNVVMFLHQLVGAKRAAPGEDVISALIEAGELRDDEIVGIAFVLLFGGLETVTNMIALGTMALLTHREQWERLCADPGLVDGAVEELLRYLTIFQYGTTMTAMEDMRIGEQEVKAGEMVTVSLAAGNRDPRKYDDPDELDVTRNAQSHMAFGRGIHYCLGAQLARVELRIVFDRLVREFPTLRLAEPAESGEFRVNHEIYGVERVQVAW